MVDLQASAILCNPPWGIVAPKVAGSSPVGHPLLCRLNATLIFVTESGGSSRAAIGLPQLRLALPLRHRPRGLYQPEPRQDAPHARFALRGVIRPDRYHRGDSRPLLGHGPGS